MTCSLQVIKAADIQRKAIKAYLSGRDVFVPAPTGAGKSVTFEQAPCTFDLFLVSIATPSYW